MIAYDKVMAQKGAATNCFDFVKIVLHLSGVGGRLGIPLEGRGITLRSLVNKPPREKHRQAALDLMRFIEFHICRVAVNIYKHYRVFSESRQMLSKLLRLLRSIARIINTVD